MIAQIYVYVNYYVIYLVNNLANIKHILDIYL